MSVTYSPSRNTLRVPSKAGDTLKGVVDFFADLANSDPFFGTLAGSVGGSDHKHTTSKPLTVRSAGQMVRVTIGESMILPPLVVRVKPRTTG